MSHETGSRLSKNLLRAGVCACKQTCFFYRGSTLSWHGHRKKRVTHTKKRIAEHEVSSRARAALCRCVLSAKVPFPRPTVATARGTASTRTPASGGFTPGWPANSTRHMAVKVGCRSTSNAGGSQRWVSSVRSVVGRSADCSNNRRGNLRLLCPSCHALTDTYGSFNKESRRKRWGLHNGRTKPRAEIGL